MTYTDKTLTCDDCQQEFAFSASEQEFFASREFSTPRRCPSCRALRKAARGQDSGRSGGYGSSSYGGSGGYGGSGSYGGSREMFSATCANCGKEAQVPFRPSGARPVYCSDCFSTRRA